MAFKNFIETQWNANIEVALKESLVLADFCHDTYTGNVKKVGDSVRFDGVNRPTVFEQNDGKRIVLEEAENPKSTAVTMNINKQAYINYGIDNVDEAIATGDLKSALSEEGTRAIAQTLDRNIATIVNEPGAKKLFSGTNIPTVEKANVLDIIDQGLEKLYEANVPTSETIELIYTPKFNTIFKQAYTHTDTDNSAMLKNGVIAQYNTCRCKLSNNILREKAIDYLIMRTKKAIAFAKPFTFTEAIRDAKHFGDVIRGYTLYDRKVLRPEELIVIPVKYA